MKEVLCEFCNSPLFLKSGCYYCERLHSFEKIYAVNMYYTIMDSRSNLLSNHVRLSKHDKSYTIPMGLAMVLLIKYRYRDLLKTNIIVPVPAHSGTLAKRGFNQAEEIAKIVSKKLNIPMDAAVLVKTKDVKMRGRGFESRWEESEDAYEFRKRMDGKVILLIDDMITGGATISFCSRELKKAGASIVNVFIASRNAKRF